MKRWRNVLTMVVGALIGAGLLWYAVRDVAAADVARMLRAADWLLAVPFLVLLFGFCATKASRWRLLLASAASTSTRTLLPIVVVGYAATVLLPLQLGELVRAAAAQHRLRIPFTVVFASIAVERTFDLLAAAVLLLFALATNPAIDSRVAVFAWMLPIAVLVLFLTLHAYARSPGSFGDTMLAPVRRIAPRLATWLREQLMRGSVGAQSVRSWKAFAAAVALSFLQLAFIYGCVAISFAACGLHPPPSAILTVMVLATLGMSLPSAPGYVGSIQAAFVVGLSPYGVPPTEAVVASLYYHILICGSLLLAGVGCLPALGLKTSQLRRNAAGIGGTTRSER